MIANDKLSHFSHITGPLNDFSECMKSSKCLVVCNCMCIIIDVTREQTTCHGMSNSAVNLATQDLILTGKYVIMLLLEFQKQFIIFFSCCFSMQILTMLLNNTGFHVITYMSTSH